MTASRKGAAGAEGVTADDTPPARPAQVATSMAAASTPQARRALLEGLLAERAARAAGPEEHPFGRWVNPPLVRLLASAGLDRRFVRGEGVHLWDEAGRRYTDLVAMYGALPFGHGPERIWSAIRELEERREPLFVQPSLLDAAGELAAKLVALAPAGLDRVTFTNSGAEAVEAAIKLARAATGRPGVLSTLRGFHGKTLGALSATHREALQAPFGLPLPDFHALPFGDVAALEGYLDRHGFRTAAFIVEPMQGEGGMHVPPPGYLAHARELCARHGVLFVLDEVQTGLGRTGALFACEDEGVSPDILLLAKALGGGIVPAGAVLSRSAVTSEEFSLRHSSTFAGNALACRAALATLRWLEEGDLLASVRANGEWLLEELRTLQRRHRDLVTDVRGRGYMIGVELTDRPEAFARCGVLADAAEGEELAALVCGHLLAVHGLRLVPTLNGARVLRVEPPLIATREDLQPLVEGLGQTLEYLEACDTGGLIAHLGGESRRLPPVRAARSRFPPAQKPSGDPEEGRWACLIHPRELEDYGAYDDTLARLDPETLQRALARIRAGDDWATVAASVRVSSPGGQTSYGELVSIPFTADELVRLPSERAIQVMRTAVERARDRGARMVGLGAFTSIVTGNGVYVADLGVPVTTGNALTAVVSVQEIESAVEGRFGPLEGLRVAVVGATGSIGRAVALLLSTRAHSLCLVGNPEHPTHSLTSLREVADELLARLDRLEPAAPSPGAGSLAADALTMRADRRLAELEARGRLSLSADTEALRDCPAVVVATSSARAFILPEHLQDGAVVVDTSEPSNLHPDVAHRRPDVLVLRGGLLRLPDGADLGPGLGLPPGHTYACIAEAILLALEGAREHGSLGARLAESLLFRVQELVGRHGFQRVAALRRFDT